MRSCGCDTTEALVSWIALTAQRAALHGVVVTGITTSTWYVTFAVRKRGILPRQRSPRETKTFATEAEAKTFARLKLEDGLIVFAGTINPHLPKRLVPSSQIFAWVAEEGADNEPPAGNNQE
jgi:hypothetical protein